MVKITGKREILFYVTQFYHLHNFTDKKFHEINKNASQIELIKSWEQHITSKFALLTQIQQINKTFAIVFSPLEQLTSITTWYLRKKLEIEMIITCDRDVAQLCNQKQEISVSTLDLTKKQVKLGKKWNSDLADAPPISSNPREKRHRSHIYEVKSQGKEEEVKGPAPSGRERSGWEEQSQEQGGHEEEPPRASTRCQ